MGGQRRLALCGWRILFSTVVCGSWLAAERVATAREPIAWQADVEAAWKNTQTQGRPLLVFVTAKNCVFCTKMKQGTFADAAVAATVNRSFVPLVLDGDNPCPLLKDLGVTAFPATFVISREAVVLDRVDGYLPPDRLMSRLAAVQATANQPSAREF